MSTFIHVLGSNPTNTGTVVHNSLHCSNILIIHYIAKGINLTKSTLRLEDDISKAGMYLCSPNVWTFQTNFIKYIYCIANTTELNIKYYIISNKAVQIPLWSRNPSYWRSKLVLPPLLSLNSKEIFAHSFQKEG